VSALLGQTGKARREDRSIPLLTVVVPVTPRLEEITVPADGETLNSETPLRARFSKFEFECEEVFVISTSIPLKIEAALFQVPPICNAPCARPVKVPWLIVKFADGVTEPIPTFPSSAINREDVASERFAELPRIM
jgi:hypothetical protein